MEPAPTPSASASSLSHEQRRLVTDNLRLAQSLARPYARGTARDEDLIQVAYVGLVKAARRYDPARGRPFAVFAAPTISGELKRHLRDQGWFVRPPRRIQEARAEALTTAAQLTQTLRREPSAVEVAGATGRAPAEVVEALASGSSIRPDSLEALAEVIPDDAPGSGGEQNPLDQAEVRAMLWPALRRLNPTERRVVYLRFFEDRTQQEIATDLSVSQMQVSRLLARSLGQLRDLVTGAAGPTRRSCDPAGA